MKWPWEKRTERAEQEAFMAQEQHRQAEEHRSRAQELADRARVQREMNGWTEKVLEIFGG